MSGSAHQVRYTYAEYVALEEASNVKHEYLGGQIYGMAGGSPEHAALAAAFVGLLFSQLMRGPCRAYSSDLRVRVAASGLATYPDVTVVCDPPRVHPDDPNAVTNPTLIAEVLSDSTEAYDRGEKFEHYRQMPSLQHYLLIDQRTPQIVVRCRTAQGEWDERTYLRGERVVLQGIDAAFDVDDLYAALPRS